MQDRGDLPECEETHVDTFGGYNRVDAAHFTSFRTLDEPPAQAFDSASCSSARLQERFHFVQHRHLYSIGL